MNRRALSLVFSALIGLALTFAPLAAQSEADINAAMQAAYAKYKDLQ